MQLVNELSDIDLSHIHGFDDEPGFELDPFTDLAPADPMWGSHGRGDEEAENPLAYANRSGAKDIPTTGQKVLICKGKVKGQNGLASVQVSTTYGTKSGEGTPGGYLRLDVRWRTGAGGGQAYVDATAGTIFTIGGAEDVEVYGELVGDVGGLNANWNRYVECVVSWGGSISPKAAYYSLPPVALTGGGAASSQMEIPPHASSLMVVASSAAAYPDLYVNFNRTQSGTPDTHYRIQNPFANGAPIVNGVRYFTLESGVVTCNVIPVFELYL